MHWHSRLLASLALALLLLAGLALVLPLIAPSRSAAPARAVIPGATRAAALLDPAAMDTPGVFVLPLTVTPPFMTLPTLSAAGAERDREAARALPSGLSELQLRQMPSAAIVGNLSPAEKLPDELSDCRWTETDGPRLACNLQVFLPPGYFDGERRYPVLYLLHGWGGWDYHIKDTEWNLYGIYGIADRLMREGEIQPFIIVAPEGGHAYWLNHAGDGQRWGDYVADELVDFMDANYRTLPGRDGRAIGGLSMGGLGAMQLALNHPDEFSVVGMRSPTLWRIGDPDVPAFFGDGDYYAGYDPIVLAQRSETLASLAVYLVIGDQDAWLERTQQFRDLLEAKQAQVEWHVYPGGHDGPFFGSHLDEELRFYSAHLHGQ